MRNRKIFAIFEWLGFILCLFGIYLNGHANFNNSKILIFVGAAITFIFFFIKKRRDS